jgi:hypothetical protein
MLLIYTMVSFSVCKEEFEDIEGVIGIRISIKAQTTQWPKEKVQKDEYRSTKHTYKTKDRVTRSPPKTGG